MSWIQMDGDIRKAAANAHMGDTCCVSWHVANVASFGRIPGIPTTADIPIMHLLRSQQSRSFQIRAVSGAGLGDSSGEVNPQKLAQHPRTSCRSSSGPDQMVWGVFLIQPVFQTRNVARCQSCSYLTFWTYTLTIYSSYTYDILEYIVPSPVETLPTFNPSHTLSLLLYLVCMFCFIGKIRFQLTESKTHSTLQCKASSWKGKFVENKVFTSDLLS